MKKNTSVDMTNQQVFGFRKPTAEIMKNKLINLTHCLSCSSPKCLSSIMCFSVWYYHTSKLSNFDFTNEEIQTNLIQPHQYTHFCSWLFFVEYTKFYMHDYDTKLQNKHKMLHDNNLVSVQCAMYWFFHNLPVAKQTLHHLHP
jgi:CRISPR/Cas system type I-B associated protein Csh2 (Cas7 group RAMP superfamily)